MDLRGYRGSDRYGPRRAEDPDPRRQFDQFEASSLFCPRCKRAVPVRKRLLLVLPEGDRYEYLCSVCSSSIGRKMEESKKRVQLIVTS